MYISLRGDEVDAVQDRATTCLRWQNHLRFGEAAKEERTAFDLVAIEKIRKRGIKWNR